VLYLVFAFSNFISPFVVLKLGERGSLIVGALTYCLYIASNVKVTLITLITASAIIGWGASVLWTAQGSVITHSSPPGKLGAYNGIFFGMFQWAQVFGNLLAGVLRKLGISISLVFIVLSSIGLSSLLGFAFIRRMGDSGGVTTQTPIQRLSLTFSILVHRYMWFMYIPIIYSGVSQTFMFGIFPKTVHPDTMPFVMAVFGAADALGSLAGGWISDRVGRLPIIFACSLSCTSASVLVFLQYLHVIPANIYISYCEAVLLGIADSGFNTQVTNCLVRFSLCDCFVVRFLLCILIFFSSYTPL